MAFDPKVKITWCGAEPTLVSPVRGAEKITVKPGETIEVAYTQAEQFLKQGRFLVDATKEEIEDRVKKEKEGHARLMKIQKETSDAQKNAAKGKAPKEKTEEEAEELESVDEEVEAEEKVEDEVQEEDLEKTEEEADIEKELEESKAKGKGKGKK